METHQTDLATCSAADQVCDAERPSFDTLDYVREIFLNTVEQQNTEKKRLRWQRAGTLLLAGLVALMLVVAIILVPAVLKTTSELDATLQYIQNVDVNKTIAAVERFTEDAGQSLQAVGDAASTLNDLDIDVLNGAIAELETTVRAFSKIDITQLNNAIQNLNDTVEQFANFMNRFR